MLSSNVSHDCIALDYFPVPILKIRQLAQKTSVYEPAGYISFSCSQNMKY